MYFKRSQLDALIERLRARRRFITPAGVLVYVAGVVLLLIILYPGEQVYSLIRETAVHDAFSVKYFENQLAARPDDLIVRRALARVYLQTQDIEKLKRILPPLLSSADAGLLREARFFEVFVYLYAAQEQYRESPELLRSAVQSRISAIDELQKLTSSRDLLSYGDQAVGRGMLVAAVQLYLLAMDIASDEQMRRRAFVRAVGALEQTGDSRKALQFAEKYAGAVRMDQQTAWYLMNLARKAERSDVARKYALMLLKMERDEKR
ncbi:MAG: hypothetical protein GX423_02230 [Nitrospiraceae bacterium]|jgi:hypothetical protein|nr:hypothetical protein [Nitrospiraceae bacterium]